MPTHYSILIEWSDADETYHARIEGLPGLLGAGQSPSIALQSAELLIPEYERIEQEERDKRAAEWQELLTSDPAEAKRITETIREQMRHMVRLDDPVVTGLVEAVMMWRHGFIPDDMRIGGKLPEVSGNDWNVAKVNHADKALSAYDARVKEVWK